MNLYFKLLFQRTTFDKFLLFGLNIITFRVSSIENYIGTRHEARRNEYTIKSMIGSISVLSDW